MIKLDALTPNYKQNVLISVNSIIDIDIGLYLLIKDEYLDPETFDTDFLLQHDILDYIKKTYFRREDNPLYCISKIKDHDLLDQYYVDFFQNCYNDIYERSTYTDMIRLMQSFIDTNEISISILYYKDFSVEQLKIDQQAGVFDKSITFIDAKNLKAQEVDKFNQIYLRSVTEFDILPIKKFTSPKNFYISSFGPNFGEDGKIKRSAGLNDIMTSKLMHDISIFDMYSRQNVTRKPEKDEDNK